MPSPPKSSAGGPEVDREAESGPVDPLATLLGEPTGDELSRSEVDQLAFSTKRVRPPAGMSRRDYLAAQPGRETGQHVSLAGLRPARWPWLLVIVGAAVLGAALALTLMR